MRIIIDAFGGDNAPDEIIKGCRLADRFNRRRKEDQSGGGKTEC